MKVSDKIRIKHKYFILGVLLMAVMLTVTACGKDSSEKGSSIGDESQSDIEFPYSLEDEKLVIDSLFQSSIANPDCNDEIGEDIASIEVINQSDQFLASAQITVVLKDSTKLQFEIEDVPAGGKVWAFETSNVEISAQTVCEKIECSASYEDNMPVMADDISVDASGTDVRISNLTGNEITELEIGFHCLFDEDVYYGGKTYTYPIETLSAGESISLNVEECYLGTAEVVRITQNHK